MSIAPELAADRLAYAYKISPKQKAILLPMLAEGQATLPAGTSARTVFRVHVCRLMAKLTPLGLAVDQAWERPGKPASSTNRVLSYSLQDPGRALALAADLPDRPAIVWVGPPIEDLTDCERAIHSALVAAGDDFCSRRSLHAAVAPVSRNLRGADAIKVHLVRVRRKAAAHGLKIENQHGVGWRYQPDRLADFLGLSVGAAQPSHLSPIKEGRGR